MAWKCPSFFCNFLFTCLFSIEFDKFISTTIDWFITWINGIIDIQTLYNLPQALVWWNDHPPPFFLYVYIIIFNENSLLSHLLFLYLSYSYPYIQTIAWWPQGPVVWKPLLFFTVCLHIYFQCKFSIISSLFSFIYRILVHISNPTNLMVTTTCPTAHVDPIYTCTEVTWCKLLLPFNCMDMNTK